MRLIPGTQHHWLGFDNVHQVSDAIQPSHPLPSPSPLAPNKNFPQFVVIHTVKDFSIVNEAEVDVFQEPCCFFDDPMNVDQARVLLSRFSRVQLCATPKTAAHQAPPSLGFSRQEHWSGLPFPSPMHESEK